MGSADAITSTGPCSSKPRHLPIPSTRRESPDSTQIRALLSYATGRQAQVERRLDEARVELQRALQLDPDLTLAKTALAELFARRK